MSLLEHTPNFSLEDAARLAKELYALRVTPTALPSERDQNFLLETDSQERFMLKIANAREDRSLLEAQNEALAHVAHLSLCPGVVPTIAGENIAEITSPSGTNFVRLLTYLPGTPIAQIECPSPELLRDLGRTVAQVNRALTSFDHPAIHRDFHWDLANGLRVIGEFAPLIEDKELRTLVEALAGALERDLGLLLPFLRESAIHNDANDYNVLVADDARKQKVAGLIDFGDMVYSYSISDLVVAIAYSMLNKSEPLSAAAHVVEGYNAENPLNQVEIAVLFSLVCMRLCMSVCHAAQQQRQRPGDDYLSISQQAIHAILPQLALIHPSVGEAAFRRACGALEHPPPIYSDRAKTFATRRLLLGSNLSVAYDDPVKIMRGSMQYLYDDQGRKYLDAYNNVPHVGHCHPRVVKAGQDQMALLNTNTRYLHDLINVYAEHLSAMLPDPLKICFFVNSGSEANELALRLARAHTRQRDLIVLEHAYHGNTTSLIDISPYKHNGPGGEGAPSWVHTAPLPDVYRGAYKGNDPGAAAKYSRRVAEIVEQLSAGGAGLCGFIAESWPSVAGQMPLPDGYLASVYQTVRAAGGVCIADEVQTAYGRLGAHFWGFEAYNVVPDIVVLGKPIGNGHPIGAVVTSPEIAASFANGMEFFSTFGGNTVSCAIGLAVLEVVVNENLQAHALRVGGRLFHGLRKLMERYSIIGDVRGSGLFLGIELVRDRDTLEPATNESLFIVNRMRDQGILLGTDGPSHNVIKIRPPMPFSIDDADLLIETMDGVLAKSSSIDFGKL